MVQVFLKKWWVESDFKAPNLPLSLKLTITIQTTPLSNPTLQNTEMTTPPDDRNLGRNFARAQKCIGIQVENVITTHHDIFSGPTEITNE